MTKAGFRAFTFQMATLQVKHIDQAPSPLRVLQVAAPVEQPSQILATKNFLATWQLPG